MGLCNVPATLTTIMNEELDGLIDGSYRVYLDEILIFSKAAEEHRLHVKAIIMRILDHKVYGSPKECQFLAGQDKFLEIIVSAKGFRFNPPKIKVLKDCPSSSKSVISSTESSSASIFIGEVFSSKWVAIRSALRPVIVILKLERVRNMRSCHAIG